MKTLLSIALICASCIVADAAAYVGGQLGQSFLIDGSTNVTLVGASNTPVCVVYGNTTNYYNMPGAVNNTNLWPAYPLLPMNNTKPVDLVGIGGSFAMTGASVAPVTFKYAVSDGTRWYSNYFSYVILATGTTVYQYCTNVNIGGFANIALQQIEHTNVIQHVTNNILYSVGKNKTP